MALGFDKSSIAYKKRWMLVRLTKLNALYEALGTFCVAIARHDQGTGDMLISFAYSAVACH